MDHMTSRRHFLQMAGAFSIGFGGLGRAFAEGSQGRLIGQPSVGYGPLQTDPHGVLDLPAKFSYRVLSKTGERMDDGLYVPAMHDGMATFAAANGRTILVRNHECEEMPTRNGAFGWNLELRERVDSAMIYDCGVGSELPLGGTTTLVYDTRTQRLERHYLSLAGTLRNCAGGTTPWGSWITCEETNQTADALFAQDHGYNFEVPATERIGLANPMPLRAMGRFRHEAVAVDPRSGIVFQTEDMDDGLIYRFLPDQPGNLAAGGRLQALAIRDRAGCDTRNWLPDASTAKSPDDEVPDGDEAIRSAAPATSNPIAVGTQLGVRWIDLDDVEAPLDDLRYRGFELGAARFARGEGMWYGRDAVYFACTTGGSARLGQVWRYLPSPAEGQADEDRSPGRLELFIEPNNGKLIENCDNLTVAPWGDIVITEDSPNAQHIVGITPDGEIFHLGRNALNLSEFAGATFSPDGSTLFVNIQTPGLTLAITGPWRKSSLTGAN
jgi:hypothetical protein